MAAILRIGVTADTAAAQAQLGALNSRLKATAATAETSAGATAASWQKAGSRMQSIGKSMTRYVSLPALAVGAASVKMAVDFNTSMEKIRNLVGVSQKQLDDWSKQILELGPKLGKSPKELADALYFITSSGIKASDAMDVLTTSAKASAIGLGDTQTVADAVTSAMNAYKKSNLSAADATNTLAKAVKFGKGEPEDLAKSIGRVIPIASKLRVPFNDIGASLASLTLQGLDAAEATTALRGVFIAVLHPGTQASDALASVHLSAAKLRDVLAKQGTLAMLELLSSRFKGNVEAMGKVFPNVRGLIAAFSLTGDTAQQNAKIFEDMKSKTDLVGVGFQNLSKTDAFKLRQTMAQIQASAVKIGQSLLPIVKDLAGVISTMASAFSSMPKFARDFLIGAVVLGPMISGIGKLVTLYGALRKAAAGAAVAEAAAGSAGGAGAAGVGGGAGAAGVAAGVGAGALGVGAHRAILAQMDSAKSGVLNAAADFQRWMDRNLPASLNPIGAVSGLVDRFQSIIGGGDKANTTLQELQKRLGIIPGLLAKIGAGGVGPLQKYGDKAIAIINNIAKHAGKIPEALGPSLQQRVASNLEQLNAIFHSGLNKIAGITQKDMLFVAMHMQQGPEQGRQAMKVIWDKTVQNIKDAMDSGATSAEKGIAKINDIMRQEAVLFGQMTPGGAATHLPQSATPPHSRKQRGGFLPGPSSGDKIPLLAEGGEFVVNAKATSRFLPQLQAMNQAVPRFQGGGFVASSGNNLNNLRFSGNAPGQVDDLTAQGLNAQVAMAREVAKKMKKRAGGMGVSGSVAGHPELQPGISAIAATVMKRWPGLVISSTTGGGHASGSYHYSGRAVDLVGGDMQKEGAWIAQHLTRNLTEGIHNSTLSVDMGHHVDPGFWGASTWAGHTNHIHLAKRKGGLIQRLAGGGAVKAHKPWRSVFGSRFDKNELTTLGAFVGMPQAALMAAIAMAESAGNPTAMGGAGDKGLWQEIPSTAAAFGTNYGTLFNPIAAATGAKKVVQGQGLNAWTTYRSGAYRSFMGGRVNTSQLAMLRGTGAGTKTKTTPKAKGKATGQGKARWQAFLDKRDRGIQGMQAEVDAINVKIEGKNALRELWNAGLVTINERRSLINELRGAGNIELLQRYQTGMSQNALLGIATPGKPALASMLAMLPMLSMLPSMPDYVAPSLASLKAASRQKKQKKQVKKHVQQLKKKHQGAIAHYDTGGVVPGPIGSPQPAIVHGGETITPPGGGGDTHVHFYIDGREIQGVVKKVVKRQARGGNRPLPSAGGGM